MGLNDQVTNRRPDSGGDGTMFLWKKDIRMKNMTGDQPIVFKILPSFDPSTCNPS